MDDQMIVGMFLDRNEDAIAEARERYGKYCVYIANNILHDDMDAEECLNDALLAAWDSIPPRSPDDLRTYLGKITRQTALDRLKTKTRKKRIRPDAVTPLDEIEEFLSGGDPESELEAEELSREISDYLYSVDETKRAVFIRRYWYCEPIGEICRVFGFGKSRVLVMLKRTRDGLAAYLKERGYEI